MKKSKKSRIILIDTMQHLADVMYLYLMLSNKCNGTCETCVCIKKEAIKAKNNNNNNDKNN